MEPGQTPIPLPYPEVGTCLAKCEVRILHGKAAPSPNPAMTLSSVVREALSTPLSPCCPSVLVRPLRRRGQKGVPQEVAPGKRAREMPLARLLQPGQGFHGLFAPPKSKYTALLVYRIYKDLLNSIIRPTLQFKNVQNIV